VLADSKVLSCLINREVVREHLSILLKKEKEMKKKYITPRTSVLDVEFEPTCIPSASGVCGGCEFDEPIMGED